MAIDFTDLKGQGFLPQKQKDRYTVRLKVVGGNLSASQLRSMAEAADLYGDGHVHLTSRQSVEIPDVRLESLEKLQALLAKSGTRNAILGPRIRPVTACKGAKICRCGCVGTFDLAVELTDRYYAKPLPSKFRIGVAGCRNNCLRVEENDLGVMGAMLVELTREPCDLCGACARACRAGAIKVDGALDFDRSKCLDCGRCVRSCHTRAWSGRPSYGVFFGGRLANPPEPGRQLLPIIDDRAALVRAIDAAVDFYGDHGLPGQRFRAVIERVGWDVLASTVAAAIAG
jgi:dissimilatory sulfite reductase (desulfoviridin) alpha/beta subunit